MTTIEKVLCVECPWCDALQGNPCINVVNGDVREARMPHIARIASAGGGRQQVTAEPGEEWRMAVRCRICRSWLTDPESVALGIGPKCSRHGGG